MCFSAYECFFCISLDAAAKIIGILYMVVSAGLTVLFSVPVLLAWEALPFARGCFYVAMAASSAALFVSACLLVVAAFTRKPSLMRPWILTSWCSSVPLIALCVVGMATITIRTFSAESAADESCVISVYFVHALLLYYFCSVVNSRRKELLMEKDSMAIERLVYPTIHNQYRNPVSRQLKKLEPVAEAP